MVRPVLKIFTIIALMLSSFYSISLPLYFSQHLNRGHLPISVCANRRRIQYHSLTSVSVKMSTGESSMNSSSPSSSTTSGISSNGSGETIYAPSLSPFSYDGSHLHWKQYRHEVLSPHGIRIVDEPFSHPLPESFVALIEASGVDVGCFQLRKLEFRKQAEQEQGVSSSLPFSQHLLPPIHHEPQLTQCLVSTFDREALPERAVNFEVPSYELSVPRSSVGYGFSSEAFTAEELSRIPRFLITSGMTAEYVTGNVPATVSSYIPFLVFERTYRREGNLLEAANNQCAVAGASCTHSMQKLYTQAWSPRSSDRPQLPVSFSCAIDNDSAIINYHWIDHAQSYCMSPVRKFNLAIDEDFDQFNVWIEAIGQWGLRTLLPIMKNALSLIQDLPPPTAKISPSNTERLTLSTPANQSKLKIALKTTFNSIPWRMEDDDSIVVSSSVASRGSPVNDEIFDSNLSHLQVPDEKIFRASSRMSGRRSQEPSQKPEVPTTPIPEMNTSNASTPTTPQAFGDHLKPQTPKSSQTKLEYRVREAASSSFAFPKPAVRPELVWQKRFGHAMDEIQDLRIELEHLREEVGGSSSNLRSELGGVKNTISNLVRKEFHACKPSLSCRTSGWSHDQSKTLTNRRSTDILFTLSAIEGSPQAVVWDCKSESNQQQSPASRDVLTVDSGIIKPVNGESMPSSLAASSSVISVDFENNDNIVVPPGPPSLCSTLTWSTALLSVHLIGWFIPSAILRVMFLGCITDFALLAWASPHWPSSIAYFSSFL